MKIGERPGKLNIVVVGASGDLACRKIYPALFSLYSQGFLPAEFKVFGFARTAFSDAEFRDRIVRNLTCRYVPASSCSERMDEFLARCFYHRGEYDRTDSFLDLHVAMRERSGGELVDTVFYLAIPPSIFAAVARAVGATGMLRCDGAPPWVRVVVEKPFGRDRASSDSLTRELTEVFDEEQIYRIDHYLGKEIVQNFMVLRFANRVFEPIWSRAHIERVWIDWREDLGLEGRAGYFDGFGIVRDVMQNHLLQIMSLIAMEKPARADAHAIRDEKVRVLRCVPPPAPREVIVGQYTASNWKGGARRGYRRETGVPPDSRTATFAAVALRVENDRWRGVPFILRAGKGLDTRESEVRIQFRAVEGNIFASDGHWLPANELVLRIQPDEGIYLSIVCKEPGLDLVLDRTQLNLQYRLAFDRPIPDAYECLLLDVLEGDKSLFIRSDELEAAWDIFTPLLRQLEESGADPVPYPFGTRGPDIAGIVG
jgi:glucose-6-phosphate 1-dehydrogenase